MLLKAVKAEENAVEDALENNTPRDNMDTVDTQQVRRDRRDALMQLGDSYLEEHYPGQLTWLDCDDDPLLLTDLDFQQRLTKQTDDRYFNKARKEFSRVRTNSLRLRGTGFVCPS